MDAFRNAFWGALVVFLILFGPCWEPWGHLWETFSKTDVKIEHLGTRGTTTNVTFLCFVPDPVFLIPGDHFLRVCGTLLDTLC